MNFKCSSVFFFFLLSSLTALFGHDFQNQVISDSIQYMQEIVTEAPEIIKEQVKDKFYLKEDRVYLIGERGYLLLANERNIPIHNSLIFSDNCGPYLSLCKEVLTQLAPYPR